MQESVKPQRIIVVEGPDGSGKTTLINKLQEVLGYPVHHTGGPPADRAAWVHKLMVLWDFKNRAQGGPVILDRLPHISETTYGPLYDRPLMDPLDVLNRDLQDLRPLIIYCRLPHVARMFSHISMEEKAHKPRSHVDLVLRNYDRLVAAYDARIESVEKLGVPVIRYAWTDDDFDTLLEAVKCAVS